MKTVVKRKSGSLKKSYKSYKSLGVLFCSVLCSLMTRINVLGLKCVKFLQNDYSVLVIIEMTKSFQ